MGGYPVDIEFVGDLSAFDESDVTVTFDGVEADVDHLGSSAIEVTAPPGCVAEPVDVEVDVDGAGSDDIGFEYQVWASGLDGAVIGVSRAEAPSAGGGVSGAADAQIFSPTSAPPFAQVPAMGTCDVYNGATPTSRPTYGVGNFLTLSTGGSSLSLALQPDQSYLATNLSDAQVPTYSSYSLTGGVDPDGCPVEYPGVVSGTAPLQVSDPVPNLVHCPPPGVDYQCWFRDQDPSYPGLEGGTVVWTPGTPGTGNAIDGLIFTMSNYDISTGAPTGLPGMICHQGDSAGGIYADPAFFPAFGMGEGAYVMNVIRYRTTATTDPRSGATVYGTFIDAKSANLWLFQTATRCLTIPAQLCP